MTGEQRAATARVLLVDDSAVDRMIGRKVLESAGHQVLHAQDGEVALSVFNTHEVDLVVTDLVMPRLNGHALVEQLRAVDPHLPIVAVSGDTPEQLDRVAAQGGVVTLRKPFNPDQLLLAVDLAIKVAAQRPPEGYRRVPPQGAVGGA